MKVKDIIAIFKEETKAKASDAHIIKWLNECEAEVQEMLNVPTNEWVEYTEDDLDDEAKTELIARDPYSKLYLFYLMARRDYANQEFEAYGNHQAQFQSLFESYSITAQREGLVVSKLPKKFINVF